MMHGYFPNSRYARVIITFIIALSLVYLSILFLHCLLFENYSDENHNEQVKYTAMLVNAREEQYNSFLTSLEKLGVSDERIFISSSFVLTNSRKETIDALLMSPLNDNTEDAKIYLGDGRLSEYGIQMDYIARFMLFTPSSNSFYDKTSRDIIYTKEMKEIPVDGVIEFSGLSNYGVIIYAGNTYFFQLTDSFSQIDLLFDRPLETETEENLLREINNNFPVQSIQIIREDNQEVQREVSQLVILLLVAMAVSLIGIFQLFLYILLMQRKEYLIKILVGATHRDILFDQLKYLLLLFLPSLLLGSVYVLLTKLSIPQLNLFPHLSLSVFIVDACILFSVLFMEGTFFAFFFLHKLSMRDYGEIS